MKKFFVHVVLFLLVLSSARGNDFTQYCESELGGNPLLNPSLWQNPRGIIPPYTLIKESDYLPAIRILIHVGLSKIERIVANTAEPTFENTLLAMDAASEHLDHVVNALMNHANSDGRDELRAIKKEASALLSDFSTEISLNPRVFARVKGLYDRRDALALSAEERRIIEKSYYGFVKNGALLNSEQKAQLKEISEELSDLRNQFQQNVVSSAKNFKLWVNDEAELKGLPSFVLEQAAAAAANQEKPEGKWLFTLSGSAAGMIMDYAENRALRQKISEAATRRGTEEKTDNREIVKKIAKLRYESAKLLGYQSYAHMVMESRMAQNPERVFDFMRELEAPILTAAKREIDELKALKLELTGDVDFRSWDLNYYSEKLKEKKYAFNEEDLRPYFELNNVFKGLFEITQRLYGLKLLKASGIASYNPDVEVYEVRRSSDNSYVGLIFVDIYQRDTKNPGAWMTDFNSQGFSPTRGVNDNPVVIINANFSKPAKGNATLLSFDEVTTVFHEFGHALHGLCSQCTYKNLSGTNVAWDFVELPSQLMESWVLEPEALKLFAFHHETGQVIPNELIEKKLKSMNYDAGVVALSQLRSGMLDLLWHSSNPNSINDLREFENSVLAPYRLLPPIEGASASTSFSHIFSGGYSAGYYSYRWADVLAADAFEMFKEFGIFNSGTANAFLKNVLSRGGSEEPMDLYIGFRGRKPDPQALLRKLGLSGAP